MESAMSDGRLSIWDWAIAYVGDPGSWQRRGEIITEFLTENGLTADSRLLDIGCGNLSEGTPLIRHLKPGNFVGLDPNGWLVEAALQQMPDLAAKGPRFLHRSDFDASELGVTFDLLVAHSVLSHCAHWQLEQLLTATRKVVDEGAVFLCSFRNDQYNSWSEEWRYPGHTTFRLPTVEACGFHCGWRTEMVPSYRGRLSDACPNDVHDWLRFTAIPSLAEINDRRLAEEAVQAAEREWLAAREVERVALLEVADEARRAAVGL
jgi:SAM-dependent methyltransferase